MNNKSYFVTRPRALGYDEPGFLVAVPVADTIRLPTFKSGFDDFAL